MAKLILPVEGPTANGRATSPEPAPQFPFQSAALYCMEPELCGNVDFVLFLSGNSTFRVNVSVVYED